MPPQSQTKKQNLETFDELRRQPIGVIIRRSEKMLLEKRRKNIRLKRDGGEGVRQTQDLHQGDRGSCPKVQSSYFEVGFFS